MGNRSPRVLNVFAIAASLCAWQAGSNEWRISQACLDSQSYSTVGSGLMDRLALNTGGPCMFSTVPAHTMIAGMSAWPGFLNKLG